MNRKSYSSEDLLSYLLGVASAADTEQMDELSISDNEFVDLLGTVEKDLLDSYVQGELDAKTLRRFEEYYTASPLRRKKVRFAQAFKEYSDERTRQILLGQKTQSTTEQKHTSFLSRIMRFGSSLSSPTLVVAAAAFVTLMTLIGWLVFRASNEKGVEVATNLNRNNDVRLSPSPVGPQPSATLSIDIAPITPQLSPAQVRPSPTPHVKAPTQSLIASLVLKPPLRGGTSVAEVQISPTATRVSARLELESDDFGSYSVEVVNGASGTVVWRRAGLKPSTSNPTASLSLNFPARTLGPGVYTVRVAGRSGNGATEIIGDYPFRVVQ